MSRWHSLLISSLFLVTFLSACTNESQTDNQTEDTQTNTGQSRLDIVKARGTLICGVNGEVPGFSFVDENGQYSGLDVDMCRAVAAALFNDPNQVEFRKLTTDQRFSAVQSGEVDLLNRNTTWTMNRDTAVGMDFAPTTFYDGQGIMVQLASGIETLEDLAGKSICVLSGTTTEQNLADQMRKRGVAEYTPIASDNVDILYTAYQEGRCEAVTADRSQLVARRSVLINPEEHKVLNVILSKEPLGPVVADGDSRWSDAITWITFAIIQGEEFGISSQNITQFDNTEDPNIKRFLGLEGTLGQDMGLPNEFAYQVINHVGNYGEIYERNIGQPLGLERGLNKLWTDGGLLYSPPFR